jgi:ADP-heptose:LPS heptosyltransferase
MPKFLVIRFSSIGDIVLTTAAIRCLKTQVAGAELHFLTKRKFKAVTEANPYIDRFHYFDDDLSTLIRELKAEHFDHVIDLHANLRTRRIRMALGRPSLVFAKHGLRKFLLTNAHVNIMPQRHVAERCLDALTPLGVQDDGKGMDHFLPAGYELPERLPFYTAAGYTAFVVGASYVTKKLPLERMKLLAGMLDHPVVAVGGPEDAAEGEALAAAFPGKIFNACGHYDLHGSSAIVRDARVVISHDTGLMHIACAFQRPVLALWGSTSPAMLMYPWYGQAREDRHQDYQVSGLSCQPCWTYWRKTCPKGHFRCMKELDIAAVAAKANELFRAPDEFKC